MLSSVQFSSDGEVGEKQEKATASLFRCEHFIFNLIRFLQIFFQFRRLEGVIQARMAVILAFHISFLCITLGQRTCREPWCSCSCSTLPDLYSSDFIQFQIFQRINSSLNLTGQVLQTRLGLAGLSFRTRLGGWKVGVKEKKHDGGG